MAVKPCDMRAMDELIKRHKINKDNLYFIGLNCGGTVSPISGRKMIDLFYEAAPDDVVSEEIDKGKFIIELADGSEEAVKIHDLEEKGEVLTDEVLCNTYLDLNKKYFGDSVISDDLIKLEWARIPHFYTSFYVYKYATGIAVACKIVSDILDKKEGALDNYMKFLSSGGSDFPLEILKKVGIDIVNDDTIDKALEMFRETLEEFKEITK